MDDQSRDDMLRDVLKITREMERLDRWQRVYTWAMVLLALALVALGISRRDLSLTIWPVTMAVWYFWLIPRWERRAYESGWRDAWVASALLLASGQISVDEYRLIGSVVPTEQTQRAQRQALAREIEQMLAARENEQPED